MVRKQDRRADAGRLLPPLLQRLALCPGGAGPAAHPGASGGNLPGQRSGLSSAGAAFGAELLSDLEQVPELHAHRRAVSGPHPPLLLPLRERERLVRSRPGPRRFPGKRGPGPGPPGQGAFRKQSPFAANLRCKGAFPSVSASGVPVGALGSGRKKKGKDRFFSSNLCVFSLVIVKTMLYLALIVRHYIIASVPIRYANGFFSICPRLFHRSPVRSA